MLRELLQGNPAYDEVLAEKVLQEYIRIHHGRIAVLSQLYGYEDVEQELRIHLWESWVRYDARSAKVSLQSWLSWRIRHKLFDLFRRGL